MALFLLWLAGHSVPDPRVRSVLMTESADYVKHYRQNYAQENGSREREIKRRVLATIDDVAGQAADRETGSSKQDEGQADDDKNNAEKENNFAEIRHPKNHLKAAPVVCFQAARQCGRITHSSCSSAILTIVNCIGVPARRVSVPWSAKHRQSSRLLC